MAKIFDVGANGGVCGDLVPQILDELLFGDEAVLVGGEVVQEL